MTGTTDSGWSQVNIDGVNAYIKSSLLSDSKTEAPKQTASAPKQDSQSKEQKQNQPAPQQSGDVTVQQPSQAELNNDIWAQANALFSNWDITAPLADGGGTTGSSGHTDRNVIFE